MVLVKLPVPGRPTIWMIVGQGPIALAVGADGGCLDIFTLLYPFSPFPPSLWKTARYRLKYCLKGPLNPKQLTNQPSYSCTFLFDWHESASQILRSYTVYFLDNVIPTLFGFEYSPILTEILIPLFPLFHDLKIIKD